MAISFALQDMVHEGAVVAVGQRDFSVTELMLQAAVEEAEQELIGQTGGAVNLLLILHYYEQKGEDTNEKNNIRLLSHIIVNYYRKSIYFMTDVYYTLCKMVQMDCTSTVPVLNVRKKSSTCWHFGSS